MNLPHNFNCGQLFWAGFPGKSLPDTLKRRLETGNIGGIILFARNFSSPEELAEINRELHSCSPRPLLLGIDQEGGRVARLRWINWPSARALGELDPEATFRVASLLASELRAFGFNTDFAPVLDVATCPENEVIGDRAFGRDPETVIPHARAFARGLAREGIFSCGKHFPGHGDTVADSHKTLPVIHSDLPAIDRIHIRPFRELADELDMIMTAHILVPALDPERPATLSAAWIRRARELPYSGVLVSDDLEMGALEAFHERESPAVTLFSSGLDMAMVCSKTDLLEEQIQTMERACRDNPDFKVALGFAAERVHRLKTRTIPVQPCKIRPPEGWPELHQSLLGELT